MWQTAYSSYSWLLTNASNQKDGLFQASFSFLIAILAISLWQVWNVRKSKKANLAPLPPGPRGLPIVGYLPFLGTDLHLIFSQLAGVYGPIFKLWLGNKPCVVISSPSLVKEVVRDHDITFSERDPPIAAQIATFGCNDFAFDSYSSPTWKKKRRVLATELLSHASLNGCYGLRREQVMKTIVDVYKNVGKPIDIGELSYTSAFNSVTSMAWGGKLEESATAIEGHFQKSSSELMVFLGKPNISDIFPVLARFDIQGIERGMKKIVDSFNQLLESIIELKTRMSIDKGQVDGKSEEKLGFLQILLELKKINEDNGSSLTMNEIKGMLMDIFVGGTDTTSTTVEWTMAELIQHPEIMEKVKKELAEVVGLNTVEEAHLPNLKYLNAVIKETFRLHPPLPLLVPRCPGQSITVGGYTIPKGSRLFLNMGYIHRDPNIWENPLEFKPERFLDDLENKFDYNGNDFRFMPFGSGRRKCPGLSLGEKMLSLILASLLHCFEWKLPQGTEHELSGKFGIVVKKKKALLLIPTPILPFIELYTK